MKLPTRSHPRLTALAAVLTAVALGAVATPAGATTASTASPTVVAIGASSYGSEVQVADRLDSGRTANLPMCTTVPGTANHKSIAETSLPGLGTIGAVNTSVGSAKTHGVVTSTAHSDTAETDLLLGMIHFTALSTDAMVKHAPSGYTETAGVTFTDLVIGSRSISAQPGANDVISIPGVATVTLNEQETSNVAGQHRIGVTGMHIVVLPNLLGLPTGSIVVGYSAANIHDVIWRDTRGHAYGTSVYVGALARSVDTAPVYIACGGTGGRTSKNATNSVDVPGVLDVQQIHSSGQSTQSPSSSTVYTQSQIADVDLFGGRITADAIDVRADVQRSAHGITRNGTAAQFVNLVVDGNRITATPDPNTAITIDGIGTLWLNRVTRQRAGVLVVAAQLVLDQAVGDLPSGAKVTVGLAQAVIIRH